MRRLAWRAASGGTAATSPPRSSMGERRKWRPVRRARAADEKNDFRNVNIGVLRLFVFVPRSVRGRIPGNGATAKKDAARELFWETRTTGCVPGTGVRGRGQRAQAVDPPRTGVFKHRSNVAGVRIASEARRARKTERKRAEESVPADRADAGSARPGIQCCGFRTDQDASGRSARREWTGQTGMPAPRAGRNRGSGSKALGMISPVG